VCITLTKKKKKKKKFNSLCLSKRGLPGVALCLSGFAAVSCSVSSFMKYYGKGEEGVY